MWVNAAFTKSVVNAAFSNLKIWSMPPFLTLKYGQCRFSYFLVKCRFSYFFSKMPLFPGLKMWGGTTFTWGDAPLLLLFSDFRKSGRFSRLILRNFKNFSKSGGILAGKSSFLFNY